MKYDFTTRVNRQNCGAAKWEQMYRWNPDTPEGVVPLSVADMEFNTAPEIVQGLKDFLDVAVLGYTTPYDAYYDAVISWQKRRHNWDIKKEWIVVAPGVVNAFFTAIKAVTNDGDGVIVFKPVYYPFMASIAGNSRTEVNVPLINNNGHYEIDFDAFEKAAKDPKNKVLLFCSPHNPVGRVWTKEELTRLLQISFDNDLYIISDEIWNDFVMPGYKHTVMATIDEKMNGKMIICTAPSKTFNLAGLQTSNIIIPNEKLREIYKATAVSMKSSHYGILGYKACETAYNKSEGWLEELILLLDKNQKFVHNYFKDNFPKITAPLSEGTYLQWLDFNALGLSNEDLEEFMHKKALFFTDEGYVFGPEGNGFERINLAAPYEIIVESVERLGKALKEIY